MVRLEEGNQREELFAMWQRIFHDTTPYTEFYFDEIYGKNEILLEEEGDQLRGMLHLNPYDLQLADQTLRAQYIVGVSTEEAYRRQGVMRHLLQESFRRLRGRGEAFTYLMPADENYYLPFSFRYGMNQYEQELELGQLPFEEKGYVIHRSGQIDIQAFADLENVWKRENLALSTQISTSYLMRLEKEVKSEFGCLFYVTKKGYPVGRFVVYAEDDSLAISQIASYEESCRKEFLQQILQFCDNRYHYRHYRVTYGEEWKESLLVSKDFGSLRVFQTRCRPVIMFRILNLEKMGSHLHLKETCSCTLKVEDPDIEEQSGLYRFSGDEKGMRIEKVIEGEEIHGSVTMAELTGKFFGDLAEAMPENFSAQAQNYWNNIEPLRPIDIPEIV